jgi:hypothetical protein
VSGGAVTVVSDDYTGDSPFAHGQVYDADSDDIPIPDGGGGEETNYGDSKADYDSNGSSPSLNPGYDDGVTNGGSDESSSGSNGGHVGFIR